MHLSVKMDKTHQKLLFSPGSIDWRQKVWYVGTSEDVCIEPHRPVYSSAIVLLTKQFQWQIHWIQRLKIQLHSCRETQSITNQIVLCFFSSLDGHRQTDKDTSFLPYGTFSRGQHSIQPLVQSVVAIDIRRVGHDGDRLLTGRSITL